MSGREQADRPSCSCLWSHTFYGSFVYIADADCPAAPHPHTRPAP